MGLRKSMLAMLLVSTAIISPASYSSSGIGTADEARDASIKAHNVPSSLQSVRTMQLETADKSGVKLKILERGEMSATAIIGVPREIGDIPIFDQRDVKIALQALHPYFGFSGTESFEIEGRREAGDRTIYDVEQLINGYSTGRMIEIWVSKKSSKIIRISGYASIDKGLPKKSEIEKIDAIRAVREALITKSVDHTQSAFDSTDLDIDGKVDSTLFYREDRQTRSLSLWWGIGIPLKVSHKYEGGEITHQWYRVSPDREVELWIEGATLHSAKTVCDGTSTTSVYCSNTSTNPLVINESGQCQPGYNCSGANNQWRTPYNNATAVDAMFSDLITGPYGYNIGGNNQHYGDDLEINIGDPGSGDSGKYTAVRMGPSQIKRASMTIDPAFTGSGKLVAHEMAHGLHAMNNWTSYSRPSTGGVLSQRYQNTAAKEYIGEVTSVIFANYQGPSSPKFKQGSDRTWTTSAGKNLSSQFNLSQMSGGKSKYENARVGGHAFYELVNNPNVNFEQAAKIFLNSIPDIADDDGDNFNEFAEMREAMIKYATSKGMSNAIVQAIRDAWADVGVGSSGGMDDDNGDTGGGGGGSTIPSSVSSISSTLMNSCNDGWSYHDISYGGGAGSTYVQVWYKPSGGASYIYSFSTNYNPIPIKNTVDASVKLKACNGAGCTGLSGASTTVQYLCW